MKKILITGMLTFVGAIAMAETIAVDINKNGFTPQAEYSGAGVIATNGSTWNQVEVTAGASDLLDTDGNQTTVGYSTSNMNSLNNINTAGGANDLFTDYAWGTQTNSTVTINGLAANGEYNLVLYGAQNHENVRGTSFTVDGAEKSTDPTGANIFVEGDTYVRFDSVTADASGNIVVDMAGLPGTLSHTFLNGFEIQAVPELTEGISPDGKVINLNNLTIELDNTGTVTALIDPIDSANYLLTSQQRPLISLYLGQEEVIPSSMTYTAGTYTFTLSENITATVSATFKEEYIVLELTSLINNSGSDLVYFFWGPVPVNIQHTIADCLGYIYNEYYGIGMMALNEKTVAGTPREIAEFIPLSNWHPTRFKQDYSAAMPIIGGAMLRAHTTDYTVERFRDMIGPYDDYSNQKIPVLDPLDFGTDGEIVGSKVALYGSDPRDLLELVEQIELNENLAHFTANEGWMKDPENYHNVNQSDYLFPVLEQTDIADRIRDARILGADLLYGHDTFETYNGDYRFRGFDSYSNFNNGISTLAAEKGLRVGTKNRVNFIKHSAPDIQGIDQVNEYATVINETTLSSSINPYETSTIQLSDKSSLVAAGFLLIEEEGVRYTYNAGTLRLTRGMLGTVATSHAIDSPVKILPAWGDNVLANAHYMATRSAPLLADSINTAGLSLSDFDGYEGAAHSGYGVYMMNAFVSKWHDALAGSENVYSYSSGMPHWGWHYFSNQTWGEKYNPPWEDEKEFNYRTQSNGDYFQRNFFPAHMGLTEHVHTDTLEIAHWMGSKAAAFNAGLVVGNKDIPTGSTQLHTMFTAYRYWTMARDVNAFTVRQRIRMADYSSWWKLSEVEPGLEWILEEIDPNTFSTLTSESVKTPRVKNVALDTDVTFSSNGSINRAPQLNNRSVTNALLASVGSGSKYLQMDLGESNAIDQIRFWHNYDDGRTYSDVVVQLSNDILFNNGVTTVYNNDTDNSLGLGAGTEEPYAETFTGKTLEFDTVTARYIRLWSNGSNIDSLNEYAEVQVLHGKRSFSGPYKRNKYPAYTDSSNVAAWSARSASSGNFRHATDESSLTAWESSVADNEWIEFDLEGTFELSNLLILWNDTNAKHYKIESSVDRYYWHTIYENHDGCPLLDSIFIPEVKCRYLRVSIIERISNTAPVGIQMFAANKGGSIDLGNLAANIIPTHTGSAENDPARVTDGFYSNKHAYFGIHESGLQHIQIDFGAEYDVSKINMWKYPDRTYHDVIIQLSTTEDFSSGVTTVFNNDTDNSAGLGVGSDLEFMETVSGKELTFAPVLARYLRLYSNESTVNAYNHWIEVQAFVTAPAAIASGYNAWLMDQNLREYDADLDADLDDDGLNNLIEYTMNMDPFNPPSAEEKTTLTHETISDECFILMSWQERQNLSDVSVTTEGSTDLTGVWGPINPVAPAVRSDLGNGSDRVTAKFLMTEEPHYFFRIKVEK